MVPSTFLTGPEGLGPDDVVHLLPAASTPATLSIRPSRILNPVEEDWGFPPEGEEMAFDEDPSKSLKVDAATCGIFSARFATPGNICPTSSVTLGRAFWKRPPLWLLK